MTNDKENYIGKQCVENKEANEIFSFLEEQISNFSAQFNGMCKKVTYSIFASSWATIFALRDNEYRIWLLITILLCILFFMIDIIYNFAMEQFSRKLHYKFEHGNLETEDVDKRWNVVRRTRQTLWGGCADANPKTCCQTIHDCPKSSTFAL